jgi:hypothetical protein
LKVATPHEAHGGGRFADHPQLAVAAAEQEVLPEPCAARHKNRRPSTDVVSIR